MNTSGVTSPNEDTSSPAGSLPTGKPSSSKETSIRDNRPERGSVADFLRESIQPGSSLSFVSAYFTVNAYQHLRDNLESIEELRFLFGEPTFISGIDPEKHSKKEFCFTDKGLALAHTLSQRPIAKACADWIRQKAEVRSIRQSDFLHGKAYHIQNGNKADAILGSSNFTVPGLGLRHSGNNIELNLVIDSDRERRDLLAWFEEVWSDEQLTKDVKEDVLRYLERLHANNAPEFIYYLTLYQLFKDELEGKEETDEKLRETTLLESVIWQKLFGFQKDGAKGAINKLLRFNGCILADSVGLGKTFEALAVIKYFETRNERVLVLSPKKLKENWTVYRSNSRLNPLMDDRFRYDVLSHTDLSRESGYSGDLKIEDINWEIYDLLVIDESHNFRNNKPGAPRPDGTRAVSRYERLIEQVIRKGARTKVLLLSATPVNNQIADLRNQISLIAGGDVTHDPAADGALAKVLDIDSIAETTRKAQTHFTNWTKQPAAKRSTRDLISTLGSDFFRLLDSLSIARSRSQIKRYYKAEMESLGGFPKREKPHSEYPGIDSDGRFFTFEDLDREISNLSLSLYHPTNNLRQDLPASIREAYDRHIGNFTQEGRERILIAMMKVNFLKRLESSIDSFRLTLSKTIDKIRDAEEKIERFQKFASENPGLDLDSLDPDDLEGEDLEAEDLQIGGKLKVDLAHLDLDQWLGKIRNDHKQLLFLLERSREITPDRDAKLQRLKELIDQKIRNPGRTKDGRSNRKILIFTAFADTARYLYENVSKWLEQPAPEKCQGQLVPDLSKTSGQAVPITPQGQAAPATTQFIPFDPRAEVEISRQNLPHWRQKGATYYITYRLADSLPQEILQPWREALQTWLDNHPEPWDAETQAAYEQFYAEKEAALDKGYGECLLARPGIREIVEEGLRHFDGTRYILDAFVVMPNHVHVVVKPLPGHSLSKILHTWKSYSAKAINKALKRNQTVWQEESFDHIIRSWEHLERFREYIRQNPAKANLAPGLSSGGGIWLKQPAPEKKWQEQPAPEKCQGQPVPGPSKPSGQAVPTTKQGQAAAATGQRQAGPATPIHIAMVEGSGGNKTTLGKSDFASILTNFSPISKERDRQPEFPQDEEIDILIATDCISEGQNLQDCATLVNYDIHWNPVRIIQRFGRIDRIGSRNPLISLINFWPTEDLDAYLDVKQRVEARMALVDLTATGEDNLLNTEQLHDLIESDLHYRNRQLKRLKDEIIELEDLNEDNLTLADFSLDDFRLDLLRYLEANKDLLENSPMGLHAVVAPEPALPNARPGVIFCFRPLTLAPLEAKKEDKLVNPLGKHFLVYVHDDGNIRFNFAQPKKCLHLFRDLAAGKTTANDQLCDLFDQRTRNGADMTHYSELARKAIASIRQTFTKRSAANLFSGRDGKLPKREDTPGDEERFYELVTWLVVQ